MRYDVVLAGVGGQGVLSMAAVIADAAVQQGFAVKQSEVHGMSQRGGAVVAHLRMNTAEVASELIPQGGASLLLSMEPLECLRYLSYLSPTATVVTAADPVRNIPEYPSLEALFAAIRSLPSARVIEAARLARAAGSLRAANMVLVGAASARLPLPGDALANVIRERFLPHGPMLVDANLKAFAAGRAAMA
jgi:indolepyruvate ferredoxin oxidoreductase beta subunit